METGTFRTDMDTLSEGMASLREAGFTHDFEVSGEGLRTSDGNRFYPPQKVRILHVLRFEGKSNPSDLSILYGLETADGKRGILLDAYGVYGSEAVAAFIRAVTA